MQTLHDLKEEDLQSLAPEAIAALAQQMLQRLRQQDSEIKFKDTKIEKITFQLARLTEVQVSRLVGDRLQTESGERAQRGDLIQGFLHRRVAQREPVLHQVHAQHGLQRVGETFPQEPVRVQP